GAVPPDARQQHPCVGLDGQLHLQYRRAAAGPAGDAREGHQRLRQGHPAVDGEDPQPGRLRLRHQPHSRHRAVRGARLLARRRHHRRLLRRPFRHPRCGTQVPHDQPALADLRQPRPGRVGPDRERRHQPLHRRLRQHRRRRRAGPRHAAPLGDRRARRAPGALHRDGALAHRARRPGAPSHHRPGQRHPRRRTDRLQHGTRSQAVPRHRVRHRGGAGRVLPARRQAPGVRHQGLGACRQGPTGGGCM
ncbi:MAG: Glucose-1-phosphate adenylyltransferase, partial [uncultured Ramlibacter sp.]